MREFCLREVEGWTGWEEEGALFLAREWD